MAVNGSTINGKTVELPKGLPVEIYCVVRKGRVIKKYFTISPAKSYITRERNYAASLSRPAPEIELWVLDTENQWAKSNAI